MFNNTKYTKWYFSIIESAKTRHLSGYVERHHIIPKCLKGTDTADNIVKLSAREHFVCHWLLTKMTSDKKEQYQLWNAFSCMLYRANDYQKRYKISSKIFENIKTAGSKIKSDRFSGENNPMFGKKGINSPLFGVKKSADHINKIKQGNIGNIRTKESRAKQSASTKGRKQSQEHIEKRKCVGSKNGRFGYKMTAEEIAHRTATMQKNNLAKKLAQEK